MKGSQALVTIDHSFIHLLVEQMFMEHKLWAMLHAEDTMVNRKGDSFFSEPEISFIGSQSSCVVDSKPWETEFCSLQWHGELCSSTSNSKREKILFRSF